MSQLGRIIEMRREEISDLVLYGLIGLAWAYPKHCNWEPRFQELFPVVSLGMRLNHKLFNSKIPK